MRPRSRAAAFAVALAPALVVLGCGASIQAVYEGDVRFEHCMALDSRADVKPTLRRTCWEEWVRFYTFGQTRDRVEHARVRVKQLSSASDFDEGDWSAPIARSPGAVPEPTTALAPPPMMLVIDAGAPARDAGPAPALAKEEAAPPGATCGAECDEGWNLCRGECKSASCEKACAGKYKRCMRRCF